MFTAVKGSQVYFYFLTGVFVSVYVCHAVAQKISPYTIHSTDYISFWSFEISPMLPNLQCL